MRKTETFVIDGVQYQLTQLGATEGVELFHELRKLAIPALRQLLTGDLAKALASGGAEALDKLEGEKLGELLGVVMSLFESMPRQLERDLRTAFARDGKVTMVYDGKQAVLPLGDPNAVGSIFDQHFAGQYGAYQKWLLAGLKLNFASFLGGSAASPAPVNPPTPSP